MHRQRLSLGASPEVLHRLDHQAAVIPVNPPSFPVRRAPLFRQSEFPAEARVPQFLKTTQIAIDGAKTLPRRYYVEPGIFAEEHERIFTRRWLCVGREDRIASPGDYFLQPVGKESIIVLRDRAGTLRAYYNVC